MEKKPFSASQSPMGASAVKIDKIFPCSVLPLFRTRHLVVAGLDIVVHAAQVHVEWSKRRQGNDRGGPASRSLDPG